MIDFLIVGQGIAGTVLSNLLMDAKQSILLIDKGEENATMVAAGNINPVTGRKFTKSWQIDEILKVCNEIYPALEKKLNIKFLKKGKIYRPLRKIQDEHQWLSREADPNYKKYLSHLDNISELDPYIDPPLLWGVISNALKVETNLLIKNFRQFLISKNAYIQEEFEYNHVLIKENKIHYKGIEAKNIIFCDGWAIVKNPFFNYLPIVPTKGEVLHIQIEIPSDYNIRDHTFVSPESNYYWVGSNYEKSFSSIFPSKEIKNNLIQKLDASLKKKYTILAHKSGVRPCVKDRKPVIGRHPKYQNVYLFNGMGTKGISLAPYLSQIMVNFILKDNLIPSEVDLLRYDL